MTTKDYPVMVDSQRDLYTREVDDTFKTNPCPRCEQPHDGLTVYYLFRPIADESGMWRWWAECPVTGDPILISDLDEIKPEWVERVRNTANRPA